MENISYNLILKRKREEIKLSLKEASKSIGINPFSLYLIEKGYLLVPKKKEKKFISCYSLDNDFFKDDLLYPVDEKEVDNDLEVQKISKNKFFILTLIILFVTSNILIPIFNVFMSKTKENPNRYYLKETLVIRQEIFKTDFSEKTITFNKIYTEEFEKDEIDFKTNISFLASTSDIGVYTTEIDIKRDNGKESYLVKLIPDRRNIKFELNKDNLTCAGIFSLNNLETQGVYDKNSNPIENKELEELLRSVFFSKIIFYSDKTINNILNKNNMTSSFTTMDYLNNINAGGRKFSSRYTSFNIGFILSSSFCALLFSLLFVLMITIFISKRKKENICVIANNSKLSSLSLSVPLKKNFQSFQIIPETFLKLLILIFLILFSVGIYFFTSNILSYIGIKSLGLSALIKHTKGLTTLRTFTTSFFQFALIVHIFLSLERDIRSENVHKKAIMFFLLGISFYIFEISIIYCCNNGLNLFSVLISAFAKFLPGNIFFALGSIILIGVFLFKVPDSFSYSKKKRIIYHTLSLIPTSYLIFSTIYSLLIKAYNFTPFSYFYSLLLYPRQASVLLFVIILYYTIFIYQKKTIKKYGLKNAKLYFIGAKYNLIKNIIASLTIIFIALVSFIIYKTVDVKISFALSINDKSIYLMLLSIIFLLYRPHFGKRNKIIDVSYSVLYALSYTAGYILTTVQIIANYSLVAPIIDIIFNYV